MEQAAQDSLRVVVVSTLPRVVAGLDQMLTAMGHRIVAVVTTPGPARRRSSTYLQVVRDVPVGVDTLITTRPKRLARTLAAWEPDLIVCMSFPFRLPQELLDLPRLGVVNGHPAYLPRWRGPNSVGWMIRNGDTELGFTFHRMDGDFDTGPILAQGTAPLEESDGLEEIFGKIGRLAFSLFPVALGRVMRGDPGDPQTEEGASYAPLFEDEWRRIDWSRPAGLIQRQARSWLGAADFAAGAIGDVDGKPMAIIKTRRLDGDTSQAAPGTVLRRCEADGTFVIQCGDGALEVLRAEPIAQG
ncbi:MAG TPA: methionyl-tRNA formyltransferase [Thermomicrobiales bacterium]|nr:methionyl-tRNA formyltransferase [Thermomicrobiales bacterium]